jgi:hypothetical protein
MFRVSLASRAPCVTPRRSQSPAHCHGWVPADWSASRDLEAVGWAELGHTGGHKGGVGGARSPSHCCVQTIINQGAFSSVLMACVASWRMEGVCYSCAVVRFVLFVM